MASTTPDPDAAILLDAISRQDAPISIYNLARKIKWSYGKTERKVAELMKGGKLYTRTRVEKGRNNRLLSTSPIPDAGSDDVQASNSGIPAVIKDAFKHLYGVFLKLGKKASNAALDKYCTSNGLSANELSRMFREVLDICSSPKPSDKADDG